MNATKNLYFGDRLLSPGGSRLECVQGHNALLAPAPTYSLSRVVVTFCYTFSDGKAFQGSTGDESFE